MKIIYLKKFSLLFAVCFVALSGAFLFAVKPVLASLILPATSCDSVLPSRLLFPQGILEDGSTGFSYGPDNASFVSKTNNIMTINVNLLFSKQPTTNIILRALNPSCATVMGFGFQPELVAGLNSIQLDFNQNLLTINNQYNYLVNPNGILKYFWVEVIDSYPSGQIVTHSYLIDIDDPKNPSGLAEPPAEPSGKRPVLIIPGIMGTEMFKGDEKLWPDAIRMLSTNNDRFMDPLAFNQNSEPSDIDVNANQVITKVEVLNKTVLNYTELLIKEFEQQGYVFNENLFLFAYDWRKDLDAIAQNELRLYIDEKIAQTGFKKLDMIAHSQGGLLVKRLLYDNSTYDQKINKLVFAGTPHLGSPKAAKVLLYGDSMGVNFLKLGLDPDEVKRISQNMPSVYQLLPSLEYFSHGQSYLGIAKTIGPFITGYSILDYNSTKQELKDFGLNSNLIDNAEIFHSASYDNYNFNLSGIQTYNIIGCEEATIAQVLAGKNGKYWLTYGPGDGTVPLVSASNIFSTTQFFTRDTNHGTMLTGEGTRQLLVNIISGSNLNIDSSITQNSGQCKFDGKTVSVHSPVELHIYDQNGNHVGPNSSGNIDTEIPGVEYDILGDDKFAFLPPGFDYKIKINATDNGHFDFYSTAIEDNEVVSTSYYSTIPISNSSQAETDLNENNDQILKLDVNGDGTFDQDINPSSTLGPDQSQDLINPITSVSLNGQMGQTGFYRSSISLTLSATDPTITGQNASGVLQTLYSLDNGQTFENYLQPLNFTSEGQYSILYYSLDRMGNKEDTQSISFVIDKTAPEVTMRFDVLKKDLVFASSDNVVDNDNIITITDNSGNQTVLKLNEKYRKKKLKAEIKELSYNGQVVGINKTLVRYSWEYDKQGSLKLLEQHTRSKKDFNIDGVYKLGITKFTGKDQKSRINQSQTGLWLLQITTDKGDFNWQIYK